MPSDHGPQGSAFLGVLDQTALTTGLDFANTCGWHAGPNPEEHLTSYEAAVAWAQSIGILSEVPAQELAARAQAHPAEREEALRRIVALREAIYRIFSAVAADRSPDPVDVDRLHTELGAALVHLRLDVAPAVPEAAPDSVEHPGAAPASKNSRQFVWMWSGMEEDLTSLLWPIARASAALLTSPQLSRVRECAGHPCGWLFLDRSKNASRRWCDMSDCGNRAKARRYRERKKGEAAAG